MVQNSGSANSHPTDSFQNLTTEVILDAVESCGHRCTGRLVQLNSMENRVFSVECENPDPRLKPGQVIAKFYRPGRWTVDKLHSEHLLQLVLYFEDIPTPKFHPIKDARFVAKGSVPMTNRLSPEFRDGVTFPETLGRTGEYFFCVWDKVAGRAPLELTTQNLEEIGATVARMHNLFESHVDSHSFDRHKLSTEFLGAQALKNLSNWGKVPRPLDMTLFPLAEELVSGLTWVNTCMEFIPTHGDLHRLNLMQTQEAGNFWIVDFDDCMWAPEIQDLWLLASGCDLPRQPGEDATEVALLHLKNGYEKFRTLPEGSDLLVEPLRTLRLIYYVGWIAGRWADPLFRDVFAFFEEVSYWERTVQDLELQREKLLESGLLSWESL